MTEPITPPPEAAPGRLPLSGWALDLARRWNAGTTSLYVLHGNIYDLYPLQEGEEISFVPLKTFLARRIFPDRSFLLFYDIGDGLTFGSPEMQRQFFAWLALYDRVENTDYHRQGPPRVFNELAPLLRRFYLSLGEERRGVTLVVDFPETIVPAVGDSFAGAEERRSLVTFLKWAASSELRQADVGILLITETAGEIHQDILRSPHAAQVRLDMPDAGSRSLFLASRPVREMTGGRETAAWSDYSPEELAQALSGLNLLRIQHLLAGALLNGLRVTHEYLAAVKKSLIEEYCQGLVRFKQPKPGLSLDAVATHAAAKKKMRELAWLIRQGKRDVLERGVLLPGRVGVGKSFLVDCFASECGLPVMEIGEFRSKWVGDTEIQQARILMTVRALGPVIVVVDEADAVFGSRDAADTDSGVSARVFAAFAAHIGDSSLRGRELWIAMTSRPDLLAIDMKRQGRFGLVIPLFPAQTPEEVRELFTVVARTRKIPLTEPLQDYLRTNLGDRPLTGSDVESILVRARERAVLDGRDDDLRLEDLTEAVESFIDPLDPNLLALQELAAVLACSDRRYLPARYREADRAALAETFAGMKALVARR
jgi:AAA+ superfamily predicted ATPase